MISINPHDLDDVTIKLLEKMACSGGVVNKAPQD